MGSRNEGYGLFITDEGHRIMVYNKAKQKEGKIEGPRFENSGMDTFYGKYRIPEHVNVCRFIHKHIHTHTNL